MVVSECFPVLIPEMTCYVSSGTLTLLTHSVEKLVTLYLLELATELAVDINCCEFCVQICMCDYVNVTFEKHFDSINWTS